MVPACLGGVTCSKANVSAPCSYLTSKAVNKSESLKVKLEGLSQIFICNKRSKVRN